MKVRLSTWRKSRDFFLTYLLRYPGCHVVLHGDLDVRAGHPRVVSQLALALFQVNLPVGHTEVDLQQLESERPRLYY